MKTIVCPAGILQANCYIIFDEASKDGAVIDPGGEADKILKLCTENGINLKYILLTHGHGDHIGAVFSIKEATGARILMNRSDDYLVKGGNKDLFALFRTIKEFETDHFICDKDIIELNGIKIEVIETPGHTPGGVCFKINDCIYSGDTLFKSSIGRSDFEFGSHETLVESIKTKLLKFSDDTKVYPGHGEATSIGHERYHNPYII